MRNKIDSDMERMRERSEDPIPSNMKTVDLDEIIVERVTPDTPGMMTHNEAITCMKEAIRQDRQIRDEKILQFLEEHKNCLIVDIKDKIQTLLDELKESEKSP